MFNIGGGEMVMLAVLALLVFGPESLPDIAKTVMRTIRAFRQASMDLQNEVKGALELESHQRKVPTPITPAPMTEDEIFGPVRKAVAANEVTDAESTENSMESPLEAEAPKEEESALGAQSNEIPPPLTVAETEQVTPESEDDDDGPGLPMTRPVPAASAETDAAPPSEQEQNAAPLETAS